MRKALAALLLFFASVSAALAQQSVVVPATTASIPITGVIATTILVPGVPGKSIYVTAIDLVPVAGSLVQFIQGTGAACATNPGPNLTGPMTFSAGQTYMKGDGYGTFWVLLPGNSLCIGIAAQLSPGSMAYAQF